MKKLLMFAAVAAALGLGSTSLSAQAYTTVTATNVTVDNGSGSPVNPPSGSQLCFLGVNAAGAAITYTPSGGGPVTGTVCGTLNSSGALTGSLQVANPALASPIGLLYTITVINGSTTYLTLPTVSLSGAVFAYDNYAVAGNGTVTGIGYPHIACNVGSQWTSTTIMPGGATCGPVGGSAAWLTYPAVPYCPVGQAYLAPQGNQTVALCLSPSLSGLGSPTGLCANKSTYFQQDAASGSFLWGCVGTAWQQEAGSGGGTGLTSFQGRTTPAATLQAADVTGVLQNSPFNFTGTNELAFDSASGTPAPTTNWLLDGSGNLGGKKNLYLGASPFSLPTITLNALTGAILGANGNFGVDASGNIMAGSLSAGGCLTAVANVITATGGGCGSSPTLYYQTAQLNLANLTQRSRLNFTSASGITAADNSGNNSTDVSLLQASTSQFGAAKCDGTSISCTGGVFTATGGGGSATLNPNPPTTAYVFYTDSLFIVSADATFCQSDGVNSSLQAYLPSITAATVSGGVATFTYTAPAAAPVTGNVLYLNGFTGTLSALNGQIITISGTGSGTFTATVTGVANGSYTDSGIAPCAYDAPRQFQQSPLVAGHGVVVNASIGAGKAADMDTDFATLVASDPAVTAAISAGSPLVMFLKPAGNDFPGGLTSCPTLSTLEGHMTSIMTKFHALAANVQVVLIGSPPIGAPGLGCTMQTALWSQYNTDLRYLYAQNAANNTAGTYYDGYIDETGLFLDLGSSDVGSSPHLDRGGNEKLASAMAAYVGTYQQKLDKVPSAYNNSAVLNADNNFGTSQTINGSVNAANGNLNATNGTQVIQAHTELSGVPFLLFKTSANGGNYLSWHHMTSLDAMVVPGFGAWCYNNSTSYSGSASVSNAPDTGMSRDATTKQVDFGGCGALNDQTGGIGATWYQTPLSTAPTGSCTSGQGGFREFGADGTSAYCPSGGGTWTAITGGGTTTNALTAATSGGAAPGTTFNGSAAVTLDYHSLGAAPLASPTFTGTPAAPTASGGTNTTQLATTAFVQAAIAAAGTGAGIVTYSGPAVALTGTQYFPIGGGATSSTTETNVDIDSPAAVTIQNMTVQMSVAPGVGNSIVFTWRKNGSPTALTCTISGASATSCSDTTHSFTTASLDLLSIQAVTTGTVAGTPTIVMAAQVGVGSTSTGTIVSQNSGSAESSLHLTGFMPQLCADTSGSGTAQSCSTANTFTPQTGNCIAYSTTTANSGTGLTVNINSLGAKSIAIAGSSGWTTTLVASSSIPANKPMHLCYDGTNWNASGTGFAASSSASQYPAWRFDDAIGPCCTALTTALASGNVGSGPTSSTLGVNGVYLLNSTATNGTGVIEYGSGTTGNGNLYLTNTTGSYSWAASLRSSNAANNTNKFTIGTPTASFNPTHEFGFDCDTTIFGNADWWAEVDGSASGATDTGLACVGAWHQFEIQVVNGAITWYADGTSVATGTVTTSASLWTPMFIAWTHTASNANTLYIDWIAYKQPTGITLQ